MTCDRSRARGQDPAGLLVEQHEADRVLLAREQHRQGNDQGRGVVELAERGPRAPVIHRRAGIDDERHTDVALLLVLLDVVAVGAREDAPVEPPKVVAGRVLAVGGKLDVEAVERAAMLPADGPLGQPARPQGEVGDLGDDVRIGIRSRRRHRRPPSEPGCPPATVR